jgi:hypothetical protein
MRCFIKTFPGAEIVRNYKTKELSVVEYLTTDKETNSFDWRCDKQIEGGCSKKRPDLFLQLGSHVIIVEIDENQHIDYNTTCEGVRMMNIWGDIGFQKIVIIRFNPDSYKVNGIRYNSCWTTDEKGLCILNKNKINEWNERLISLKTTILHWVRCVPSQESTKIDLYYTLS